MSSKKTTKLNMHKWDQTDTLKLFRSELNDNFDTLDGKITEIDAQVAEKSTKNELTDGLAPKTDKTYVDDEVGKVTAQLADKTTVIFSTFTATSTVTRIPHDLFFNPLEDTLLVYGGNYHQKLEKGVNYTENIDNLSIDLINGELAVGESIEFELYQNSNRNIGSGISSTSSVMPYPNKFNFQLIEEGNRKVMHLSKDGRTVYAGSGSWVHQSKDDGDTWETIGERPNLLQIISIRELADGELLVGTKRDVANNIKSALFKTNGYKRDNHTTTTYTKVLDAIGVEAEFDDAWCVDTFGNIVVANEYGSQGSNGAIHAFISTDYGNTWTMIFDQKETTKTISGAPTYTEQAHLHTIHYDRYQQRIWLAAGDSTNCATYYSDDLGQSWNVVNGSVGLGAIQYTGIISYPEAVFFGSDRAPDGVYRYDRSDNMSIKPYHLINRTTDRSLVFAKPFRRQHEKDEVTYFTAYRDIAYAGQLNPIIVGIKGVKGVKTLIDFTDDYPNLEEPITACVGNTVNGNVLVSIKNNNTGLYQTLRVKAPVWE